MAWTFVRPTDVSLLAGRPLLDLGTGDGQTLSALLGRGALPGGLVVGIDRSLDALPAARRAGVSNVVGAEATRLPFMDDAFDAVLAGDLFHHMDDDALPLVLDQVTRVLRSAGRLVAWWYERAAHPSPDAPAYPRTFDEVASVAERAGLSSVRAVELEIVLPGGPATLGLTAVRAH